MMAAAGILPDLLPGALQLARLEHLALVDADNGFPPDPLLRLAALLPDDGEVAGLVGEKLRLSNADKARLENLSGAGEKIAAHLSAESARKMLYCIGAAPFKDRVRLRWAASPCGMAALPWRMLLSLADGWKKPRFPLTGRDAMAAGVPEGPAVGQVLAQIEAWWIDKDFPDDAVALAQKLKDLAGP
jgi:poly(A) polymerase